MSRIKKLNHVSFLRGLSDTVEFIGQHLNKFVHKEILMYQRWTHDLFAGQVLIAVFYLYILVQNWNFYHVKIFTCNNNNNNNNNDNNNSNNIKM